MARQVRIVLATVTALVIVVARPLAASAAGIPTYLALGDSMAFGETDFTKNPSSGDRGYVSLYADHLGTQNGGVRPHVINYGVDAETTTTFFQGGPQGDGTISGFPAPQLNTNYPSPQPTQDAMLGATLLTAKATNLDIQNVSVQLGANDLFVMVNTPGFLALPPAQQQAQLVATLGTIGTNYTKLLQEIRTALPGASVELLGYHNPFGADPGNPLSQIAGPAILALNGLIAQEAAAFNAKYVDTYTPFLGHELDYTLIGKGNVHPNDAGYAVIAAQMVPEPCSLAVLGTGLAGLVIRRRRRSPCAA